VKNELGLRNVGLL